MEQLEFLDNNALEDHLSIAGKNDQIYVLLLSNFPSKVNPTEKDTRREVGQFSGLKVSSI
jgi:hypothetical protein